MSSIVYVLQHHHVHKVMFIWLVVRQSMREEWRFVSETLGCQFAIAIIDGM